MILFQPKKFATPLTYQLARAIMAAEDAGLVLTETAEAEVVNDCVRLTDHAWPGFIICWWKNCHDHITQAGRDPVTARALDIHCARVYLADPVQRGMFG